jgi:Protein of unknown function (DUF559)
VTTAELSAAGWSDRQIHTLVRRHILLSAGRGLYARRDAEDRAGLRSYGERLLVVAAAVAVAGPEAAASHGDAAVVHGIDLLDGPRTGPVVVSRPPGATGSRTSRDWIIVRPCSLPAAHVTSRHQVKVTSAARTVVDLARSTSVRSGVVAADSALHAKLTTKDELGAVLAACEHWPGIRRAREVVEFSDGRSESALESIARVVFSEYRLPPPDLQVWVGGEWLVAGRVDFLWRKYRTVAEADGALKYADPDRARRQLQRDAQLRAAGFEVVHFSWNELHLAPWQVADSIRAALNRGA